MIRKIAATMVMLSLSAFAWADGGSFLFVYGQVFVQADDGQRVSVVKGDAVASGDLVITAANGRAQIRMDDGGLLALRPNTVFLIEDFHYADTDEELRGADARSSRSFYRLLKGGFRSVTGAIAKEDKEAYKVTTPVATIGIRGTDYNAIYCDGECSSVETGDFSGLFVSVNDGAVVLSNDQGSLEVGAGEKAVVNKGSAPASASDSGGNDAASASTNVGGEAAQVPAEIVDGQGNVINVTQGNPSISNEDSILAFTAAPFDDATATYVGNNNRDNQLVSVTPDGRVVGFSADSPIGDSQFSVDSQDGVSGGDESVGLRWGRWASGSLSVVSDPSMVELDLASSQLHWVSGMDGADAPALPVTGSASFNLIGNTNPTDSLGNVGNLGSANLSADFTSQTVDADVNLSINQHNWDASATGVAIDNATATFGGAFDAVDVTNTLNPSDTVQGSGDLSGFFVGDQDSVDGAGMSYSLTDGESSVSGTAAFQNANP